MKLIKLFKTYRTSNLYLSLLAVVELPWFSCSYFFTVMSYRSFSCWRELVVESAVRSCSHLYFKSIDVVGTFTNAYLYYLRFLSC